VVALFVAVALSLVALVLLIWSWIDGPATVFDVLRYGDTQTTDWQYFPRRTLRPAALPFQFAEGSEAGVPATVSHSGKPPVALEQLLRSTDTVEFLVIKGDTVRYERYFQGYTSATPSMGFSMSKSWTSMLIGAAIADGYLRSVDQPVTDYVPELAPAGFAKVRILDLLQMTSGMDYVEDGNPFGLHTRFGRTHDLEQAILGLKMREAPGAVFSYKSGDMALLSLVLERAISPQTISGYMEARLWQPLGMEHAGYWNTDHDGGLERAWCCLAATARDYAKLGRLYLRGGEWDGKQLIPQSWVRVSTGNRRDESRSCPGPPAAEAAGCWDYQYNWWLVSKAAGDYMAFGKDGQYVYVNPARDVVIVRLGRTDGGLNRHQWPEVFTELAEATP
jgi:CubicO group peptidase (beta-lactamase class C family)